MRLERNRAINTHESSISAAEELMVPLLPTRSEKLRIALAMIKRGVEMLEELKVK